jgi:hypothetical protein
MSDMGQTHQHGASSQIHTFSPSIFLSAIVLGVAIPAHLILSDNISRLTVAITIAIIAGAYIGFGANDGRPWMFLTELCIAALFGVLALLGVIWSPYMFVAALFLHGVWDLIHHNGLFGAKVPRWYIPFCVVIDWIAAAGLFILFAL